MTRAQFLNSLYRRLGGLTREQAEQHLTYYAEMLADRMEEGMTEEEAVASMEDVETIARRILQDEGAQTVQPPRAPELPKMERAAGFSGTGQTAAVRPKRDWRKPAKVLLWTLAVLAAGGMLFSRFASRNADTSGGAQTDRGTLEAPEAPEAPDSLELGGIRVGPDGIHVGDGEHSIDVGHDGIHIDGDWSDWSGWENWVNWDGSDYSGSYDYAGEVCEVAVGRIRDIEISWTAGEVDVLPGEDGVITFQEESGEELTEDTRLVWKTEGEKLSISFRKDRTLNRTCKPKRLAVYVPRDLLDELDVETASAGVWLDNLTVESVDVSTTSGDVTLNGISAKEVEVSTVSGCVGGEARDTRELDVETTSGDVTLYAGGGKSLRLCTISGELYLETDSSASEIGLESVSGDAALVLTGTADFTLEFSTVSGDLDMGGFQTTYRGGQYTCGGGGCRIEADSVSGDLTLLAG